MKNKILTFVLFVLSSLYGVGQNNYTLSGKIMNSSNDLLMYATITLKKADGAQKVFLSDSSGNFTIKSLQEGSYWLGAKYLGYEEFKDSLYLKSNKNYGVIRLKVDTTNLKDLVVTASSMTPIERLSDRFIVRLDKSILNKGKSVYQALNYAPGIIIDQNAIMLNGKKGVKFMLNGKRMNMDEKAVVTLLNGLRAEDVEKIEIIANPGAEYDASSASGIIDIHLNKNAREGLQFNLKSSATFAYQPSFSVGPSLSWKKDKLTLFGSYYFDFLQDYYKREETIISEITQDKQEKKVAKNTRSTAHSYRTGINYEINEKNDIGLEFYGTQEIPKTFTHSFTGIIPLNATDSTVTMQDTHHEKNNNNTLSLNYNYSFARNQTLSLISDFTNIQTDAQSDFLIQSSLAANKQMQSSRYNRYNLFTSQIDYGLHFSEKYKLSVGSRFYNLDALIDESLKYYEAANWMQDPQFTYDYAYAEQLIAAYSSFDYKNKNLMLKLGLRSEWLKQNYNKLKTKNGVDLFPSVSFKYDLTKNTNIALSYGKHINRAPFRSLMPFYYFESPYTISTGNQDIVSSYTNTYNATLGYKDYSLTFSYDDIDNMIYQLSSLDPAIGIIYLKNNNIKDGKRFYTTLDVPLKPTKWWRSFSSITFEYEHYHDTKFLLDNKNSSIQLRSGNIFEMSDDFSFEINVLAMTRALAGPMMYQKGGAMFDAALTKTFAHNKWIANISVNDIFGFLNHLRETANYNNLNTTGITYLNSRKITFTVEYNLNKGKKYNQRSNRSNNWIERERTK